MTALIVVPALNEAPTLGAVVAGARRHGAVLVVDDGSSDGSDAVARGAGAEVVRHPRRLGKGQAIRTGVAAARARGAWAIVTLDGDGQHDPDDIPRLLAAADGARQAIVVGNRLDSAQGMPALRANASRIAGFFVRWASGLALVDTQSGFRVYPLALLDEVPTRRGGFVFETEVLVAAAARGFTVIEVPVRTAARPGRRSRFRPLIDGAAIGVYLAGRALARWAGEAGDAAREVGAVFGRARRRARHGAILEAAAPYADAFGVWAAAVGAASARRAAARLTAWWRHPRLRGAAVAAWKTLAAPPLLLLVLAQALAGRAVPDLVSPLVRRLYASERECRPAHTAEGVEAMPAPTARPR